MDGGGDRRAAAGSVEGEPRGGQSSTPLADELQDVLTLWTVSRLEGKTRK